MPCTTIGLDGVGSFGAGVARSVTSHDFLSGSGHDFLHSTPFATSLTSPKPWLGMANGREVGPLLPSALAALSQFHQTYGCIGGCIGIGMVQTTMQWSRPLPDGAMLASTSRGAAQLCERQHQQLPNEYLEQYKEVSHERNYT